MSEGSAVTKRCVFYLSGYEPLTSAQLHARFRRELERSARSWSFSAQVYAPQASPDGHEVRWSVDSRGPNWSVTTSFSVLRWDDFVTSDFDRPPWHILASGLGALLDFIVTGAAWRFFRTSWRYGLFFLYPILVLALFATAAIEVSRLAAPVLPVPDLLGPLLGLAVFFGLTIWPGRPLYLGYLLADWSFARDYARGRRPALDARLDQFAETIVTAARESDADEIIIFGHSLGAALKLDVMARALQRDPDLGRHGKPVLLVSAGSSLLKIALHPSAGTLRAAVARVASEPSLNWVEYQSVVDVISFYKADPLTAIGLPALGKPDAQTVRIRAMLDDAAYRRFRFDFFRLHRQLVMGNDKRHFYDFIMICCGPIPMSERIGDPDRVLDAIGSDGAWRPTARSRRTRLSGKGDA